MFECATLYGLAKMFSRCHSILHFNQCDSIVWNHISVDSLAHCRSEAKLVLVLATGVKGCH